MIRMASSRASIDSPALRRGPPSARMASHIGWAPVPMPSSKRPLLRMSSVVAARANIAGGRSGRLNKLGNTRTRLVRAAMAASRVRVSRRWGQYG